MVNIHNTSVVDKCPLVRPDKSAAVSTCPRLSSPAGGSASGGSAARGSASGGSASGGSASGESENGFVGTTIGSICHPVRRIDRTLSEAFASSSVDTQQSVLFYTDGVAPTSRMSYADQCPIVRPDYHSLPTDIKRVLIQYGVMDVRVKDKVDIDLLKCHKK
jgi:hypothetical protein